MPIGSKNHAQKRADQVESFQAELEIMEQEHILSLSKDQHAAISHYHQDLIGKLFSTFDIDSNNHERQLSLGMKITSFLGAFALGASVFFLFYQFWGRFSTSAQLFILILTPLIGLFATMLASDREKTGYFAKIFALVTLGAFILNLSMIGQIFNVAPSENAFLVWAIFAFLLAYAIDARLLLGMGIILMASFLSAKTGTWSGCYWINFGERPENFFPAAIILFLIPLLPHNRYSDFGTVYRVFAMLLFFLPVLILSNWGLISYMDFSKASIEGFYQIIGFVMSATAIFVGIKKGWMEVINTGNVFFTIFLYTKFYDWWWEWMPKYLFFLLIGLTAILMLFIFKRLRNSSISSEKEVSI